MIVKKKIDNNCNFTIGICQKPRCIENNKKMLSGIMLLFLLWLIMNRNPDNVKKCPYIIRIYVIFVGYTYRYRWILININKYYISIKSLNFKFVYRTKNTINLHQLNHIIFLLMWNSLLYFFNYNLKNYCLDGWIACILDLLRAY